jgi:hypothetical protein
VTTIGATLTAFSLNPATGTSNEDQAPVANYFFLGDGIFCIGVK